MKKLAAVVGSIATFVSTSAVALASTPTLPEININPTEQGLVRITDVGRLLNSFVSGAIVLALIMVLFYLVLGGIQWITSGGDKGKTEAARNKITSAIIGLAIVAASWAIFMIVGYVFGVNIAGDGLESAIDQIRPY